MTDQNKTETIFVMHKNETLVPIFGAVFLVTMGCAIYLSASIGGIAFLAVPSQVICLIATLRAFFIIFGQNANIALSMEQTWKWHRHLQKMKIGEILVTLLFCAVYAMKGNAFIYPHNIQRIGLLAGSSLAAFAAFIVIARLAPNVNVDNPEERFAINVCRGCSHIATLWIISIICVISSYVSIAWCWMGWPAHMTGFIAGLNIAQTAMAAFVCAKMLNGSSMFGGEIITPSGPGLLLWTFNPLAKHKIVGMIETLDKKRSSSVLECVQDGGIDLAVTTHTMVIKTARGMETNENEHWYASSHSDMTPQTEEAMNIIAACAKHEDVNFLGQFDAK